MQRRVGKLGNMERMTGWIHRAVLVKSGRVQNQGGFTYKKVEKQARLHITVPKKGKEKKGRGREGESNYRGG